MRRLLRLGGVMAALGLLFAFSASATLAWHQHEIVHTNPATDEERVLKVFDCEPVHIANDPHPRHFGLHAAVVPSVGADRGNPSPITVRAVPDGSGGTVSCPTE